MTARERVIAAINFQKPDRVPHSLGFTWQLNEKMIEYTGDPKYKTKLENAIAYTSLIKPQVEVRPEYFADEYGVIWNKTGIDKDIGVVDNMLLEETEDLESFEMPSVDEEFIRSRLEKLCSRTDNHFRVAACEYTLFERAWTLRGMENLLCDMLMEPEIYGLDFARNLYGKIAVWGGLSTQRDLPSKTPDEVREITRQLLDAFPNGGLIASPTHTMPIDIPPENVFAMLDVLLNQ